MGNKKAYIDKKVIIEQYKYNGYKGLRDLFMKSNEIIYMSDREFCEEVVRTLFLTKIDENKRRMKISKILI